MESDPGRVALLWERDEPGTHVPVTYTELYDKVGTGQKYVNDDTFCFHLKQTIHLVYRRPFS